jgi:hypothetical protein
VAAPKKNGKVRWCVDFRSINASTVVDTHPIGNIKDNLSRLSRSKIYSALDCTGAFHAIDLEDEDKEKTSFATPWGSFQFTQLPFGLCGGPMMYARLVNLVLNGIPYDVALPYLDNTVIHTATLPDNYRAMDKVLGAMSKAGLKLQPTKCQIFAATIDYLGNRVNANGISTIPEYILIVRDWPMPKNRTAIRAFLGKCGYYRRFVANYAGIAGPLYTATVYPPEDDRSRKKLNKEELEVTPAMEE